MFNLNNKHIRLYTPSLYYGGNPKTIISKDIILNWAKNHINYYLSSESIKLEIKNLSCLSFLIKLGIQSKKNTLRSGCIGARSRRVR